MSIKWPFNEKFASKFIYKRIPLPGRDVPAGCVMVVADDDMSVVVSGFGADRLIVAR